MNYSLQEHFKRYDEDTSKYIEDLFRLFSDNILNKTTSLSVKSHILTVILQRRNTDIFRKLHSFLDLPEIVKACEILDAKRFKSQTQRKLEKYPNSKKLSKRINDLDILLEKRDDLSFSLSKIKMVKEWVRSLSREKIEYRAIMFSTDLWKKLADLTHLNPKTDFAESCSWFLPYCFGEKLPEGCIVQDYNMLNYDNFKELYSKHNFSFELIRSKLNLSSPYTYSFLDKEKIKQIKISIVNNEDLNTIIWYWDELVEEYNINDVLNRIKANNNESGNDIVLSYGKIVDVISKTNNDEVMKELVKIGEERLSKYNINLAQPVAIFGDQSGSMEIAIKTSGIITSLLCLICNASLHLFHDSDEFFSEPPRTITDAVKFGKEIKTKGSTAPASSLMYYYSRKITLASIILITDEEENTSYMGYRFADLYLKYLNEVCNDSPTKLVFISFSDQNKDAEMVSSLKNTLIGKIVNNKVMSSEEFNNLVKVFKFNVDDPDLNRMDVVLKYLSGNM